MAAGMDMQGLRPAGSATEPVHRALLVWFLPVGACACMLACALTLYPLLHLPWTQPFCSSRQQQPPRHTAARAPPGPHRCTAHPLPSQFRCVQVCCERHAPWRTCAAMCRCGSSL